MTRAILALLALELAACSSRPPIGDYVPRDLLEHYGCEDGSPPRVDVGGRVGVYAHVHCTDALKVTSK